MAPSGALRRGLRVGDVVKGEFSDGERYLATVAECRADGTYLVDWFDGDDDCRVRTAGQLQLMRFSKERQEYIDSEPPEPPVLQPPSQEEQAPVCSGQPEAAPAAQVPAPPVAAPPVEAAPVAVAPVEAPRVVAAPATVAPLEVAPAVVLPNAQEAAEAGDGRSGAGTEVPEASTSDEEVEAAAGPGLAAQHAPPHPAGVQPVYSSEEDGDGHPPGGYPQAAPQEWYLDDPAVDDSDSESGGAAAAGQASAEDAMRELLEESSSEEEQEPEDEGRPVDDATRDTDSSEEEEEVLDVVPQSQPPPLFQQDDWPPSSAADAEPALLPAGFQPKIPRRTEAPVEPEPEQMTNAQPKNPRKATAVDLESAAVRGDIWKVVGGASSGGIVVRQHYSTASARLDRLSTGSLVRCEFRDGDRMQYELIQGQGPANGWVSVSAEGRDLLVLFQPRTSAAALRQKEERRTAAEQERPMPGPATGLVLRTEALAQRRQAQEERLLAALREKGPIFEVRVKNVKAMKKPQYEGTDVVDALAIGELVAMGDWDRGLQWRKCTFPAPTMTPGGLLAEGWVRLMDEEGWPCLWPKDARYGTYDMDREFYSLRALYVATHEDNLEHLRRFLADGANPNARDGQGRTAAMHAARWGRMECCVLLAKFKADLGAQQSSRGAIDLANTAPLRALLMALSDGNEEPRSRDVQTALDQLEPNIRWIAQDLVREKGGERDRRREAQRALAEAAARREQLRAAQKAEWADEGERLAAQEHERQQRLRQQQKDEEAAKQAMAFAWLEQAQMRYMAESQAAWAAQVDGYHARAVTDTTTEDRRARFFKDQEKALRRGDAHPRPGPAEDVYGRLPRR